MWYVWIYIVGDPISTRDENISLYISGWKPHLIKPVLWNWVRLKIHFVIYILSWFGCLYENLTNFITLEWSTNLRVNNLQSSSMCRTLIVLEVFFFLEFYENETNVVIFKGIDSSRYSWSSVYIFLLYKKGFFILILQ